MKRSIFFKKLIMVMCFILMCSQLTIYAQAAPKVKLNKKSVTITVGQTSRIKVTNTKEKATWSSKNKKIATVSKTGLVKGIKQGSTTINAKIGKTTLTCKVTIKKSNTVKEQPVTPTPTPETGKLQTSTYNLNGIDFKMILVEGGTFTMGHDERAAGRGTQVSNQKGEHEVTLSSFLIGETEVTRALWNEVMNGRHSSDDLNYPIASVTVPDCRDFVDRLNEKAHAAGIIPDDINFHMLTEAQWEFAAKGGNQSKGYVYAGSNDLSEVGWTSDDGSSVHKVKQKKANELGLYDMSGNVYEWVADYAAPYSTEAQTDPCNLTPSNDYIKRGGSFYYNDNYRFTTTYRYFYSATDYTIGLRIGLY